MANRGLRAALETIRRDIARELTKTGERRESE
jgi:ribosomal protein L29